MCSSVGLWLPGEGRETEREGDQKRQDRTERFQPRDEMNTRGPSALESSWALAMFHLSRTFSGQPPRSPGDSTAPMCHSQHPWKSVKPHHLPLVRLRSKGTRGQPTCVSREVRSVLQKMGGGSTLMLPGCPRPETVGGRGPGQASPGAGVPSAALQG